MDLMTSEIGTHQVDAAALPRMSRIGDLVLRMNRSYADLNADWRDEQPITHAC